MESLPFRGLLATRVVTATCAYAAAAAAPIEISLRAIRPVFYAIPIEMGGLKLDAPAIGIILAIIGILNGVLQVLFFVRLHDWLGGKNLYLFFVFSRFPMLALFPAISFTAKTQGLSYFVYLLVGLQLLAFIIIISYSCTYAMHLHPTEHKLVQQWACTNCGVGELFLFAEYHTRSNSLVEIWLMAGMVCIAIGVGFPRRLWCE
ncbi:hypothetical protein BDR05DRAFT_745959 [Suillus weaverae]|nr:hypothetical protein BDR05DRAFT_745959 [Suillus weaverae]